MITHILSSCSQSLVQSLLRVELPSKMENKMFLFLSIMISCPFFFLEPFCETSIHLLLICVEGSGRKREESTSSSFVGVLK